MQKKKEEEAARDKELNELFKVAISQPKVPQGMIAVELNSVFAYFSLFWFTLFVAPDLIKCFFSQLLSIVDRATACASHRLQS